MPQRRRRPFWAIQYREARGHAFILAAVLWIGAALLILGNRGERDRFDHLKGADFVHFYTLGRIALGGDVRALYDVNLQHELQTKLVPASAPDTFLPVYPPQTALLFAPLSLWSYPLAALMWAGITALLYALLVRAAWRSAPERLGDAAFVAAAAAAFPPFWYLMLHGQTTAVPLVAFGAAWKALEHNRKALAGLALGLLAIKPQFGLVVAVVVLACAEWRLLAGITASVAAQAAAVVAVFGAGVLRDYVSVVTHLGASAEMLEPKPFLLHSIRALTNLVPGAWSSSILWVLLSAIVAALTVRVWRSATPVAVRVGVLVLASTVVNPHLTVYDATVLALPLLWLGAWVRAAGPDNLVRVFWPLVYALFATFLFPTALVIRVQVSTLLLVCWFFMMTKAILQHSPSASRTAMVTAT
jgi:hypothetical protein